MRALQRREHRGGLARIENGGVRTVPFLDLNNEISRSSDGHGELLLTDWDRGQIFRVVPAAP